MIKWYRENQITVIRLFHMFCWNNWKKFFLMFFSISEMLEYQWKFSANSWVSLWMRRCLSETWTTCSGSLAVNLRLYVDSLLNFNLTASPEVKRHRQWFELQCFQELIAEKMGERVKGIMGSPFKRTSKYLTHQIFNRLGCIHQNLWR